MSKENSKNWERPWTTEEIVDHADNWNLACDAALLNTLKTFGDKILKKAEDVNEKIENLTENLAKVHLQVDLARNEFSSLRNTQFVECRVYEDDETLPSKTIKVEEENIVPAEETIEDFKEAVSLGLEILDEYYDRVKVAVSDSEEEEDDEEPSYVYRRKDPYINRRLPHIIGSEEWHKKWHVGLEDTDSENEQSSEKFSDSESDDNFSHNKDKSDVSSELSNFSGLTSRGQPVISSTANATKQDILGSASGSDNSLEPTPKASFAEQLAAKLGNVIKETNYDIEEPEVNRRPIQKKPSDYGALFSDEPPPLDDVKVQESHGIFSGGKGLFDDDDDDDLWSSSKTVVQPTKDLPSTRQEFKKSDQVDSVSGLFDNDDSDSDIFATSKNSDATLQNKQPYLQSKKPLVPVFDEEPPLFDEEPTNKEKKKPTGGVSLFGKSDIINDKTIGKILKQRKVSSSSEEDEPINNLENNVIPSIRNEVSSDSKKERPVFQTISETDQPIKRTNLFDDDIFGDDLFSSVDKKRPKGLFEKGDLFSDEDTTEPLFFTRNTKNDVTISLKEDEKENSSTIFDKKSKNNTLFSTQDTKNDITTSLKEENSSTIFDEKSKNNKIVNVEKSKGLFDDLEDDPIESFFTTKNTLKTGVTASEPNKSQSQVEQEPETPDSRINSKSNITDDGNEDNNFFTDTKTRKKIESTDGVKEAVDGTKTIKSKLGLFDDLEDVDDLFSGFSSKKDKKSSLFDDEDDDFDIFKSINTSTKKENTYTTPKIPGDDRKNSKPETDLFSQISETKNSASISSTPPSILREQTLSTPSNSSNLIENLKIPEDISKSDINSSSGLPSISEISDDNDNVINNETKTLKEDTEATPMEQNQTETTIPKIDVVEDLKTKPNVTSDMNVETDKFKSSPSIQNVHFMDPMPPSDDDWDTYSDNAYDDMEDIVDSFKSHPSSLFDNEPPSLFYNDAGVQEDVSQNVPSDIFTDGDNCDLSDKTAEMIEKNEADTFNDQILEIIDDNLDTSVCFDDKKKVDENKMKEDVENKIKEKPPISKKKPEMNIKSEKSESLFDVLDEDQTDFLFSSSKPTSDKISESEISENIISKDKIIGKTVSFDDPEQEKIEANEPVDKLNSEGDMPNNISRIAEKLQQISSKTEERTKNLAVPGKLSHNLNINVGALLPGSAIPIPKKEKVQDSDDDAKLLSKSLPASRFSLNEEIPRRPFVPTKPITISRVASEESSSRKEYHSLEKSVSFDGATDIEVLRSVTKNRARIPVKRRPSSRRARQKSLRDSMSDFRLDDPILDEVSKCESDTQDSTDKTVQEQKSPHELGLSGDSNENYADEKASISTDQTEDLFKTVTEETKNVSEATVVSTKKKEKEYGDLFDETQTAASSKVVGLFGDNDIFGSEFNEGNSRSIFVDDEINEKSSKKEFHGSIENQLQSKVVAPKKFEENKSKIDKLFDSSDDDDIFKSTKKVSKVKTNRKEERKIEPSISIIGKIADKTSETSSKIQKSKTDNLFDFSDDEDFLENFSSQTKNVTKVDVTRQSKSLFDDMDNDDIFGTSSIAENKTKQDVKPSVINKKTPKSTGLRKLENVEGEDDPLSALLK